MPFDGKNFTETKPDVFSLEGLIAWLEKQPAETTYNWLDMPCNGGCLIHRYLVAQGQSPTNDYGRFAECAGGRDADTKVAMREPYTYGAALERARALQSRAA